MIYNDKFKVVKNFEELTKETDYNVLYITDDPNKALVYLLMTYEYRAIGAAYSSYKHCDYLGSTTVVWVHNNDLPKGYQNGLYYKGYSSYEKYRASFPFPFTPAKYTDAEIQFKIDDAKSFLEGLDITVKDKKDLKALWPDVVFNMTWLKDWIKDLALIEQKRIDEKKTDDANHFRDFLNKVFSYIPELERVKNYWNDEYKNEWKCKLPYGEIRFTCYSRKQSDGTYIVNASSSVFGDREIRDNHRKKIIKLIQIMKKYQGELSEVFSTKK